MYATAVARQIKNDYPDCHLTWAIGSMNQAVLEGNPFIDHIWVVPMNSRNDLESAWWAFEKKALELKKLGAFDKVFFTQIHPGNLHHYDGTIRSSIFRGYPRPITVSVMPVIRLAKMEIQRVEDFSKSHNLSDKSQIILFEYAGESSQSFVTTSFAIEVSKKLVNEHTDLVMILSSRNPIQTGHERIIDGSNLTFRENAELTKYCTLMLGCSSGISWLATSDWAKPLPMVQLIKKDAPYLASFEKDHLKWGLPLDQLIEISECSSDRVVDCVREIFLNGFNSAKSKFNEKMVLRYKTHAIIVFVLVNQKQYLKGFNFFIKNCYHAQFLLEIFKELNTKMTRLFLGWLKTFKGLS